MEASFRGHLDVCELLIKAGAKVDLMNKVIFIKIEAFECNVVPSC